MSAADALFAFASAIARFSPVAAAEAVDAAAAWLLAGLLRASMQGVAMAGAIWIVCRLAPRMPAGARAGLWWLAALQLLVGLAWPHPMTLAVLPPPLAERVGLARATPRMETRESDGFREDGFRQDGFRQDRFRQDDADRASLGEHMPAPPFGTPNSGLPKPQRAVPPHDAAGAAPEAIGAAGAARVLAFALAGVWTLVALWRLLRLARMRRQLRQLVARAAEPPAAVQAVFDRLCARVAPRQRPALRVSDEIEIPQVSGARHPVILLPARRAARLSPSDLSMTLFHELTHVTRGDLWLGWVPAIARELFFFHPLAALAAREYGLAREAACDAAVIHALDAEPREYGRLLVTLGVSGPRAAHHAPLAAAGSSSSVRLLKRRLVMLQDLADRPHRSRSWWPLTALTLVGLVPVQLTGQRAQTAVAHDDASAPIEGVASGVAGGVRGGVSGAVAAGMAAAVAGEAGSVSSGVPGGVSGGVSGGVPAGVTAGVDGAVTGIFSLQRFVSVTGQDAGAGDGAGTAAGAGAGAGAGHEAGTIVAIGMDAGAGKDAGRGSGDGSGTASGNSSGSGAGIGSGAGAGTMINGRLMNAAAAGQESEPRWVLLRDAHRTSMNGDSRNLDRARSFQKHPDEPLLWVRVDDGEFVVRDEATLVRIVEAFRPMEELGRQQGELSERQGALGAEQGKLGAQQGRLGAEQGLIGGEQGRLAARRAVADARRVEAEHARDEQRSEAAMQKLREYERTVKALEEEQRQLSAKQDDISRQQEALGRQQEALGRKQEALGQQQEALGRKQEEASRRAEQLLKALIAESIQSGVAQRIR